MQDLWDVSASRNHPETVERRMEAVLFVQAWAFVFQFLGAEYTAMFYHGLLISLHLFQCCLQLWLLRQSYISVMTATPHNHKNPQHTDYILFLELGLVHLLLYCQELGFFLVVGYRNFTQTLDGEVGRISVCLRSDRQYLTLQRRAIAYHSLTSPSTSSQGRM